ncbi:MAG: hypothetical protein ABW171_17005 [Steroidobacter sp.]
MRLSCGSKRSLAAAGIAFVTILLSAPATLAESEPAQWPSIALSRALQAAGEVQDPYRQAEALASIARAQATLEGPAPAEKIIRRAIEVAGRIQSAEFRGWVLHDIVLAQIAADDPIGARQTAESINVPRPQSAAYAAIASLHIGSGDLPAAQTLALRISEPVARGDLLRQIVTAHCRSGDIEAARAILPGIEDKHYSALAYGDVAAARFEEGDLPGALSIAARAKRANRNEVYGRIALAQTELGDFAGALKSLQLINEPIAKALVQGRIGLVRVERKDAATGREMIVTAMRTLQEASLKTQLKLAPLAQLARWQASAGDEEGARQTLRNLRAEADRLPPGTGRDEVLDYIGRSQARIGDTREAIDAARNITDRVMRALLVRDAVSLHPGATTSSAAAWASEFSDPLVDAAAQFGVLSQQSLRGEQQPSLETIDAARAAVRRITDRELLPAAYAALAAVRARAGDVPGSREIFQEALTSAEALSRGDQIAAACVRIVDALNERLMFLGRSAVDKTDQTK